jgi:hypothetical protein
MLVAFVPPIASLARHVLFGIAHTTDVACRRLSWSQPPDQLLSRTRPILGKYIIGWLLGVPTIVLVIIYLIFNH